jgi:hypothetical protein
VGREKEIKEDTANGEICKMEKQLGNCITLL